MAQITSSFTALALAPGVLKTTMPARSSGRWGCCWCRCSSVRSGACFRPFLGHRVQRTHWRGAVRRLCFADPVWMVEGRERWAERYRHLLSTSGRAPSDYLRVYGIWPGAGGAWV